MQEAMLDEMASPDRVVSPGAASLQQKGGNKARHLFIF